MHEWRLTRALVNEIVRVARSRGAVRVLAAKVGVSPHAGIAPDILREQFAIAATGGMAEGASLQIELSEDPLESGAAGVYLKTLEIEA